jgi:hypothetical protein
VAGGAAETEVEAAASARPSRLATLAGAVVVVGGGGGGGGGGCRGLGVAVRGAWRARRGSTAITGGCRRVQRWAGRVVEAREGGEWAIQVELPTRDSRCFPVTQAGHGMKRPVANHWVRVCFYRAMTVDQDEGAMASDVSCVNLKISSLQSE